MVSDISIKSGDISVSDNRIIAGCGELCIEILEIQPEGRKRLSAPEFLRGYEF